MISPGTKDLCCLEQIARYYRMTAGKRVRDLLTYLPRSTRTPYSWEGNSPASFSTQSITSQFSKDGICYVAIDVGIWLRLRRVTLTPSVDCSITSRGVGLAF